MTVDVVFRTDEDAVKRSTDMTPAWGEEVVIEGVPVLAAPPAR